MTTEIDDNLIPEGYEFVAVRSCEMDEYYVDSDGQAKMHCYYGDAYRTAPMLIVRPTARTAAQGTARATVESQPEPQDVVVAPTE